MKTILTIITAIIDEGCIKTLRSTLLHFQRQFDQNYYYNDNYNLHFSEQSSLYLQSYDAMCIFCIV